MSAPASAPGYVLFTDATADLAPASPGVGQGATVLPMEIVIDENRFSYGPSGDLSVRSFYAMQRAGRFARTSQINPASYRAFLEPALRSGLDVLYLGFSSGMSSTLASASLCAEELRAEYPGRRLICKDTLAASVGEGLLVRRAEDMWRQGMDVEALSAWIDDHRLQACHWFTVDGLEHLRHGGRISGATAVVGGLLDVKPLLHVDPSGQLKLVQVDRGRRRAIRALVSRMAEGWQPSLGREVVVGHADDPKAAHMLCEAVADRFPEAQIHTAEIGPVIGAHTGPGMLALSYWGDNR
ncbi:MAG: DegV family protein [Candidatus Faecivicinus sp.]